jgi:uncharacterized protein YggE
MGGLMEQANDMARRAPPPVLAGTNTTQATVNVDFALAPK